MVCRPEWLSAVIHILERGQEPLLVKLAGPFSPTSVSRLKRHLQQVYIIGTVFHETGIICVCFVYSLSALTKSVVSLSVNVKFKYYKVAFGECFTNSNWSVRCRSQRSITILLFQWRRMQSSFQGYNTCIFKLI